MASEKAKTRCTTDETLISPAATVMVHPKDREVMTQFINQTGADQKIKPEHQAKDSFSSIVGGVLKVVSIGRGKISCSLHVKSPILNGYGGMFGGAVAAVAERVAIACVRTIVPSDKHLFLTELSVSYLSNAPRNAELAVDGSVIRSGRNLTVVAVDFRVKESGRLAYMTRETFYNMPVSSL